MKYLGEHFDMHTGGTDNKFPHHENEIAQSEAATGKKFVNYWLHTAHLMVDGEKMSKSLGNFFTLRDLLSKGLKPMAIRYVFLNTNYRQQLNFTFNSVSDAQNTLEGLQNFIERLRSVKNTEGESISSFARDSLSSFEKAMDDDLNVPEAMKYVFEFARKVNKLIDDGQLGENSALEAVGFLKKIDSVLGVLDFSEKFFELTDEQQKLFEERNLARKGKDWKKSDLLRDKLKEQGIEVVDNKDGTASAKAVKK
jgi:cysteinyl-tRNA synthetase